MNKLPRDKWGAPIFGDVTRYTKRDEFPQGDFVNSPDDVSGIGLKYPKPNSNTMGAQYQEQYHSVDMIRDAMAAIGEEMAPMNQN